MSKSSRKATRGTHEGRWTIVDECRVPEGFHIKSGKQAGKRRAVHPAITKAVLRALAKWDSGKPDKKGQPRQNYTGLESIRHSTQLGERSITYAIAVLKEAGILSKKWRGFQETCLSSLDWTKIQSLRVEFRPDKSAPAPEAPRDEAVDAVLASLDEPRAQAGPQPQVTDADHQALFDLVYAYEPYRTHLSGEINLKAVGGVCGRLLQKHDLADITLAWNSLTGDQEWRKNAVFHDDKKNPAGYLYKVLDQETTRQKLIQEEALDEVTVS